MEKAYGGYSLITNIFWRILYIYLLFFEETTYFLIPKTERNVIRMNTKIKDREKYSFLCNH